jgi:hypothetical protein
MVTGQGHERAEPCTPGEGHGRGADSGNAAPKNAPASGERHAETGPGGTREVSGRPWPTSPETRGIRPRRSPGGGGLRRRRRSQDGGALRQQNAGGGQARYCNPAQRGGQ